MIDGVDGERPMNMDSADVQFMQAALACARRARFLAPPNPAVGCVITSADGKILGEGHTLAVGGSHAEIVALQDCHSRGHNVTGATLYVTLEPCCHHGRTPPCTDSIIRSGVTKVVIAVADPDPRVNGQGIDALKSAGIAVESGLLEAEALELNSAFFHRVKTGRPLVRIKLASSLDGRTAMQSGESMWITGEGARRDVQYLRAESDCILTGSGTVLTDDPSLNVRLTPADLGIDSGKARQPLRAIVDSRLRIGPEAKLFEVGGPVRIYTDGVKVNKNNSLGNKCEVIPDFGTEGSGIELRAMLEDLGKLPVNLVHVEAGATLCGALLLEGLADEIVLYLAPHLMGNQGKPQFILPEMHKMDQRISLDLVRHEMVGQDLRLTLGVARTV